VTASPSKLTAENEPSPLIYRATHGPRCHPLIGLAITVVILRITWTSWQTIHGHTH
jgi:hypothetical protein